MKKMLILLLVLLLFVPSALAGKTDFANDAEIADDVTGFVITSWNNDPIADTTADRLIIVNTGEGEEFPLPETMDSPSMIEYAENAWHWAEENRGFGDFIIAKELGESILRFCYDGTTADPDTEDDAYYDYLSHYYRGATEGQVERIYVPEDDRMTAYIKFFHWDAGVHTALRVEWIPDSEDDVAGTGSWRVSNFYKDNVRNYNENIACARFNYYDRVSGVEVTTQKSNLNVRSTPGGEIIGSLKKGSTITVYKCEEMAPLSPVSPDDGQSEDNESIPFTLISKWTKPDADGYSTLEYFGWVATEYITEDPDWVWVYGD